MLQTPLSPEKGIHSPCENQLNLSVYGEMGEMH